MDPPKPNKTAWYCKPSGVGGARGSARRGNWPPQTADLLVVGASVRAAAQSAARAGLDVIAADRFADSDLIAAFPTRKFVDYDTLIRWVAGGGIAREWMYTGALENRPDVIRALARHVPLVGNDSSTVRAVRDPWRVAECLGRHGIAHPEVRAALLTRGSSDRALAWLQKRVASAGGMEVRWARQPIYACRPGRYFQQFIRGISQAAVFVAAQRQCRLLMVTRQLVGQAWTGADGFRYCGSVGPLALTPERAAQWQRIGQELSREFGLVGLFGVDAVADERAIWPVEVNPRYSASMELLDRAHGVSAVGIHCRACGWGELPGPLPAAYGVFGKVVLYARGGFRVPGQLVDSSQQEEFLRAGVAIADLPAAGSWIPAGRPIVTLLTNERDPTATLGRLRMAARQVFQICLPCLTSSE